VAFEKEKSGPATAQQIQFYFMEVKMGNKPHLPVT
jgi:hypothetical protein